jgi:SAM-dependent methyltransferase
MMTTQILTTDRTTASALSNLRADHHNPNDTLQVSVSRPELYLRAASRYFTLLKNDFIGHRPTRDQGHVFKEYERHWTPDNRQYADANDSSRAMFLLQGKPVLVNGWFIVKRYTDLILEAIERLKVTSVLEVGAGRGKNLALFALRKPELELTGLELTDAGVANSLKLADDLPEQFLRVAGVPLNVEAAKASLKKIQFHRGDAMKMPFADKSFDVSFTSLVLEQLPRDFPKVLQEMRRVTRRYCMFNEAFAEANNWRGRKHLERVDYFRTSLKEFERHGLEPVFFTTALPQKFTFRSGFLIARVKD